MQNEEQESLSPEVNSRSVRRHHRARVKANRGNYWGHRTLTAKDAGKLARTPKRCSCYMCTNPRKVWGEGPMQETRQLQAGLQET